MQTVYFLVCIVQLPLFVWSQSNNITFTAGRSVTVSSSHGNQLTTEYSLDVEPASILFNSLSLSVHLTTPDIEHPSTSEYKLTPSSVTVVTTNTLDGFVSSSAREQTNNFLSYTFDKVSLTNMIASSSLIETVPEKMSSQSTISISASHFSGEVIQPTVSTVFNKEIPSDHQVVSNKVSKSNDIVPTSSGTSSVNIDTSKYTTGTKSETVSASSVLMETSEPTTIANLKPSTDVLVSSSDLTSTDIKQPPSTLTETTRLHSSGVGDSLSTVNRIVSSIMDTQSALPLSRSSSIESTSHFVLQSSQMSSLTPLKSIGGSSVIDIVPTTSTSIVSMVTSDMRRSSLSQEILNSNKITSTFFEETKFSVSPTFSQQKSSSESVRYSDGESNTVFTSSFVSQTIAGSLSLILSTSDQSPDSSMILQSIKTTVPINSKMDTSGFSDVSASLQSTFSSNTDLQRSTILTTLSEQMMSSAALTTINLDKESFGTTRTEIMSSSRTFNFVQTSGWTPSLISDLFTVKSSSQSDIAMDILSTLENLSLSTSKQDIKSTSILISDTAWVMSLSVTHPSVTMAHQSSSSVSSAFYPVDSSLIPTNFTKSSLYQETSKLHLESGSVSITSDVALSNTVTTEMIQSATISPSDSMSMIYSTEMSGIFTSVTTDSNIIGSDLFASTFNTFDSMLTTDIQTESTSNILTGSQVMGTPSLSFESLTLVSSSDILTLVTNMSQTLSGSVLTSARTPDTNIVYSTASSNMVSGNNTVGYLTSYEFSLTATRNDVTSVSDIILEPTLTVSRSSDFNLVSSFVSSTAMFNASVLSSVILSSTLDLSSSVDTLMSSVNASTGMMVTMATSGEFYNFSQSSLSHSITPDSTMFSDIYATTKTMGFDTLLPTSASAFFESSQSLFPSLPSVSEISVPGLNETSNVAMETSPLLLSIVSTSAFESFQTKFIQSSISEISQNGSFESVFSSMITPTSDILATTMDLNKTSIHSVSAVSSVSLSFTTDLFDKISTLSSISDYSFSTINVSHNITESSIYVQTSSDLFVTMETVSSFSSVTVKSLLSPSSHIIMQTVTASSDQFSPYDNLTQTVSADIMTSLISVTMVTMPSSYVTSDISSLYLPIMSSISATGSSTAFSQTIQPSSMLSSVSVEISSEIIPTPSTRDFSTSAAVVSMTSSELILQTMTSSVVVLNSTESVFLRTSIMPTSSLFISDSVNISSQLMMSSNMSAPVSQQTSQFPAFSSILPSLTSLPISDNITMIQSSVTTTAILLKTSSLNMSETEMLMSSTPVLSSRIQDLQTSSVLPVLSSAPEINATSSVPSIPSSSATTLTTTPTVPPATTTPNLADTYWVKTVIKVPLAENASATEFLIKLETRLIQAYNTAYERQQQIAAGTFTPLKKRRRRKKRLTQVGDTAIDIKESTRSSGNVSLSYTVEKAGTLVPATEVIQTLGVLSDQEMAIILQYVVASKAETHKKSYDGGTDATTSANNLWIIGVALGGIVLLIIIIWVILCVVVKKHRASEKSGGGQGEPHLIGMKSPPGEEGEGEFDGTRVNPKYIEELAERGDNSKYSVQSPKRQAYEVNTEYQEEPEYAQVKKTKKSSPSKHSTKKNQSRAPYQGHSDYENVSGTAEDTELIASPSKSKRSGKQKKSKQQDTFEDEEVAAKSYHPVSEIIPRSDAIPDTRQYSADVHDDEELKKRKEQERKKNKQRIREKKRRERKQGKKDDDYVKEYLASQQEIDTVLEAPPADGLPDVFKDKSTKSTGESKEEMSFSNEAYTGDESLQEARKKMHKLLDDAFSLISPSASMNGSSANVGNETLNEDRKHEPLYITPPAYRLGEEPGLATWSPYRAADQVALISMPKKMQTTVISNDRRGGGKRPIALFNDSGVSNQPEILTDEPPKPIILKTRQLMSNKEGQEKKGDHHRKQSYRGSISQTKPVLNGLESDSAGLTNLKSSTLVSSSNSSGEKNKNLASSIVHSRNKPSHSDNRKDSVEMTTLNGDLKSKRTNPHHAPLQVVPDGTDETDIVSRNVRSSEMPKTTIQSIRNELKSTSLSTSYRPERKASGTLADIA